MRICHPVNFLFLNRSSLVNHHRLRLCRVPDHHPSETSGQLQDQVSFVGYHGLRDPVRDSRGWLDSAFSSLRILRSSVCCVVKIIYLGDLAKGDFTCTWTHLELEMNCSR